MKDYFLLWIFTLSTAKLSTVRCYVRIVYSMLVFVRTLDVLRPIAGKSFRIEDKSDSAAVPPGLGASDANVEELAI